MKQNQNTIKHQVLATICCNIVAFSYGTACAWGSVNFLYLQSDDTHLSSGPLSVPEAALVVSLLCAGGLIGNVLFVFVTEKFGRKLPLLFLAIPEILSWVLLYIATNPYYLYVSRILSGITGGGCLVLIPIYVSEIASDRVRGSLGSVLVLSINFGILFGFVVGEFFNYFSQIRILLTAPILFLILFNYFPESPEFLLVKEKKVLAEKSIGFYRGVLPEEPKPEKNEKEVEQLSESTESLSLSSFFTPAAKKALFIGIILSLFNQLCGCFAMVNYTTKIFADAGSTLPPSQASIIIGFVQLLANCLATILVDRAGRKVLFSLSAVGTGLGLLCLGCHSLFKEQLEGYNWIPVVAFSMVIFMASIGILPLQFVILVEVMPKKIRNAAASLCTSLLWLMAFLLTQYYPMMTEVLGMHGCMFLFGTVCFLGALFIMLVVPETRGKSHTEIMRALEK